MANEDIFWKDSIMNMKIEDRGERGWRKRCPRCQQHYHSLHWKKLSQKWLQFIMQLENPRKGSISCFSGSVGNEGNNNRSHTQHQHFGWIIFAFRTCYDYLMWIVWKLIKNFVFVFVPKFPWNLKHYQWQQEFGVWYHN